MANSHDSDKIHEEVRKDLQNNNLASAAAKIKEYLEKEKNIPLNIAITGESGSGKSTFVNAIRGVDDDDEGAAPTGVVETTMEVKNYPHPKFLNVNLWDLPGVGTTKFPADEYLKQVGFERFDFFIIISANRFRENDVKLAKEIKKMGKKFYFLRSRIDLDIQNAGRKKKSAPTVEETLKEIKENCVKGLQQQGFQSPQVFLVSSFDLHLYDFSRLAETLEKDLPEHKRNAFLLTMPNISLEVIKRKKEAFESKIKYHATLSAAVAGVPVPGLSIAVDASLLVAVVTGYVDGFGLDNSSLQKLASSTGVPLHELKKVIKSPLASQKITSDLILKLLSQCTAIVALMAAEEATRFIPIIGIIASMGLSFTTTYKGLSYFLDVLADDAQRVFQRALGLNTTV